MIEITCVSWVCKAFNAAITLKIQSLKTYYSVSSILLLMLVEVLHFRHHHGGHEYVYKIVSQSIQYLMKLFTQNHKFQLHGGFT